MTRTRISAASLAGDRRSPLGYAGSLLLHGVIIAGMLFTFSHKLDIVDESTPVVPVDLVTLSNKTNVIATARPQPKVVPEIKPTPVPPAPAPAPAPTPPSAQTDTPLPPPDQAASEPLVHKALPPPVPRQRPQETPPKEEKKKFDVDSVLALLNKVAPAPSRSTARTGPRDVRGIGDQTAMTADLTAMLSSQIRQCYSPPVGAPSPEDLVVDFDVVLNPDGSVSRATQLADQDSNPYFAAAAAAARRAIFTCAPYKLPQDRYSQWREIDPLHFDPRSMMGD